MKWFTMYFFSCQIKSETDTEIKGTHTTPVKHYVDDLTFNLMPQGSGCTVAVSSQLNIFCDFRKNWTQDLIHQCTCTTFYQSPLILTELFQHNLINVSYLTACYLYQVMMTLHFLNDVANDAEPIQ